MKVADKSTLLDLLRRELEIIDTRHEKVVGNGVVIAMPGGYLSGNLTTFSLDFHRAFVFKSHAQANDIILRYRHIIPNSQIIDVPVAMVGDAIKAIHEARRLYRITEVALYNAERDGRNKAIDRLRPRLRERWEKYRQLLAAIGGPA